LYAQLEACDLIQARRRAIWELYRSLLSVTELAGDLLLPKVPAYSSNNAHMFYLVCPSLQVRTALIERLKASGVMAIFHYQSLHASQYFAPQHDGRPLHNADRYTDCLLRLPLFFELSDAQINHISSVICNFFSGGRTVSLCEQQSQNAIKT
jgi:dTDP-4-amino-4,6-dideoxygalactose transaminase